MEGLEELERHHRSGVLGITTHSNIIIIILTLIMVIEAIMAAILTQMPLPTLPQRGSLGTIGLFRKLRPLEITTHHVVASLLEAEAPKTTRTPVPLARSKSISHGIPLHSSQSSWDITLRRVTSSSAQPSSIFLREHSRSPYREDRLMTGSKVMWIFSTESSCLTSLLTWSSIRHP